MSIWAVGLHRLLRFNFHLAVWSSTLLLLGWFVQDLLRLPQFQQIYGPLSGKMMRGAISGLILGGFQGWLWWQHYRYASGEGRVWAMIIGVFWLCVWIALALSSQVSARPPSAWAMGYVFYLSLSHLAFALVRVVARPS